LVTLAFAWSEIPIFLPPNKTCLKSPVVIICSPISTIPAKLIEGLQKGFIQVVKKNLRKVKKTNY